MHRTQFTKKAHGCPTGKKRFRDHRECVGWLHHAATAQVRVMYDKATTEHRAVRSYECGLCQGFHVTSQALAA